jgi:hypothetical protein
MRGISLSRLKSASKVFEKENVTKDVAGKKKNFQKKTRKSVPYFPLHEFHVPWSESGG